MHARSTLDWLQSKIFCVNILNNYWSCFRRFGTCIHCDFYFMWTDYCELYFSLMPNCFVVSSCAVNITVTV